MSSPDDGRGDPLLAHVDREGEGSFVGRVLETRRGIATVDFAIAEAPVIPIAEPVQVVMAREAASKRLEVRARVVSRVEREEARRYQFQLLRKDALALNTAFGLRKAFRVSPGVSTPVEAQLLVDSLPEPVVATIHDLSVTGMSVLIESEDETLLCRVARMRIAFELPGLGPFTFAGAVRHRSLAGAAIRYGFEFDSAATPGFERLENLLAGWLQRRQVEVLRLTRGEE